MLGWGQRALLVAVLLACADGLPGGTTVPSGRTERPCQMRPQREKGGSMVFAIRGAGGAGCPPSLQRLRGGFIKPLAGVRDGLLRRRGGPEQRGEFREKKEGAEEPKRPSAPPIHTLHLPRKAFHIVAGCLFAWLLNSVLDQRTFVAIFAALGFGGIFGETLRINTAAFNRFFYALFGAFMREHEVHTHFSGMVFYLLGIAAAGTFDTVPGVIGILMLTFGDPAAGAIGLQGQRMLRGSGLLKALTFRNGKTLVGSVGCFAACALASGLVLRSTSHSGQEVALPLLLAFSAAMGCVTAIVELLIPSPPLVLPFKRFPLGLDDNLLLPAIAALAAQLLLSALGLSPHTLRLPPSLIF